MAQVDGGRHDEHLVRSTLLPLSLAVIHDNNAQDNLVLMSLKDLGTHLDFWLFHKLSLSFWLSSILIGSGVGYLWY